MSGSSTVAAEPRTLTVSYHTAETLPSFEPLLLNLYAEIYAAEAATDPFFSVERFTDRLRRHAAASRWGCVLGEVDGALIGYAYGFARTADYGWAGLVSTVSDVDLEEHDTRTFALCEVMVRQDFRGTGTARTLHEELLSHRIEERSNLLVDEGHPKVLALYERWGYSTMGIMQPYPDSPRYVSMLRPIRL
ncbi:GNAT family N-acetyltransferase [Kitasatospora purpeofusca]|uniref:GNAT family N-acetyltransferase n=1 Tax=Kitasatospora purpeofusca TaxID=67352 RepID=UPI0035DDCE8B